MIELVVELFAEVVLEVLVEGAAEAGFHAVGNRGRKPVNPWLATLGYLTLGAALGGVSLLVFSAHFMPLAWRLPNLIVAPFVVGGVMTLIGRWRARRNDPVLRIDRFAYGYAFALSFALVRYLFAA